MKLTHKQMDEMARILIYSQTKNEMIDSLMRYFSKHVPGFPREEFFDLMEEHAMEYAQNVREFFGKYDY